MTRARSKALAALLVALPAFGQDAKKADEARVKQDPTPIEAVKLDRPADFKVDVFPILKSNCLACHNAKDAEADLVLETPKAMLKGGESGPAIVPGKGEASLLLKVASLQKKPLMPPKNNKAGAKALTPKELGLIKLWIDQGAKDSAAPQIDPPKFQAPPSSWNPVYAAALDAEGEFAACGRAGRLYLYHLPTRRQVDQPVDLKLAPFAGPGQPGLAHLDAVQSAAFSPDGSLLATGGYRSIKLWRRELAEQKTQLPSTDLKVAAVSPDGSKIAAAGPDAVVRLFDAGRGKVMDLKWHTEAVTALRFSADGAQLLSGSADRTVRTWNVADGAGVRKLDAAAPVTAVEWAGPKQVAAGGADAVVRVWSLEGEAAPRELKGHAGPVTDLAFSPAGLVSASQDGKAIFWNLDGGQKVREMAHGAPVAALAVSADGKRLVTAGGPAAKLWETEKTQAVAELRTDGPARRRDQYAQALLAFAGAEVTFRQGALKAAQDAKVKEEEEVKKSIDAVPPIEKDAADKEAALVKARQGREALDRALADAAKGAEAAKGRADEAAAMLSRTANEEFLRQAEAFKAAADQLLAQAEKALAAVKPQAEAAAKAAADAKAREAEARKKADADQKAAAQALADREKAAGEARTKAEAAAKAAADAKAKDAEAKKNAEAAQKAAQAALAEAEKALGEAKKKLEGAKTDGEKAAAEKAAADARKKRDDAKAKADAASKGAGDGAAKKAEAEKEAADKALAEALAKRDEAKKAADAAAAALKEVSPLAEAASKAEAAKAAQDQALAQATKDVESARAKAESAARFVLLPKTGLALAKAEAEKAEADKALAPLAAAADPAKAALDAAAKASAEAKGKLDAAAKALDEAKKKQAAATDEAGKKAAEEAVKRAEAARASADGAFRKAEAARQAAEKASADAAKKRDEAKARVDAAAQAAQQAKAASEAARKAAEGDKAAADQALKAAEAAKKDAETKQDAAKKAEAAAAQAAENAKLALESAKGRVDKAKESVARSEKAIQDAAARLEQQKQDQQRREADRKQAAEALTKAAQAARSATFSPDGTLLALAGEDGRVYTYGGERGEEASVIPAHAKAALAVRFAVNGTLISVGADGSARAGAASPRWVLRRSIEPADPAQPPVDRVTALAFSPDGKTLASGGGVPSREGELVLWNPLDGTAVREFMGAHSDAVYSVTWNAEGTLLASAAADKFAKVFDAKTGKYLRSFEGHTHHVLGVGWNRTGRTIATAGADDVVKVWNVETGQQVRTVQGFAKQATALRYLPFGDQFVVAAGGAPVRLVGENGQTVRNFDAQGAFIYALALSADGRLLAAGGLDGALRVWTAGDGKSLAVFTPK